MLFFFFSFFIHSSDCVCRHHPVATVPWWHHSTCHMTVTATHGISSNNKAMSWCVAVHCGTMCSCLMADGDMTVTWAAVHAAARWEHCGNVYSSTLPHCYDLGTLQTNLWPTRLMIGHMLRMSHVIPVMWPRCVLQESLNKRQVYDPMFWWLLIVYSCVLNWTENDWLLNWLLTNARIADSTDTDVYLILLAMYLWLVTDWIDGYSDAYCCTRIGDRLLTNH